MRGKAELFGMALIRQPDYTSARPCRLECACLGRESLMSAPRTVDEVLSHMRLVWFSVVAAFVLVVWSGETLPGISWLAFPAARTTIGIVAVFYALWFLFIWKTRYSPALRAVRSQPEDMRAVIRWMTYRTALLCIAMSAALFGFAFRMGGKTLRVSLPFYVTGFLFVPMVMATTGLVVSEMKLFCGRARGAPAAV